MFDTFDFEIETSKLHLFVRVLKVEVATGRIVWTGKWRIRRRMILQDITERSFYDLLVLIEERRS